MTAEGQHGSVTAATPDPKPGYNLDTTETAVGTPPAAAADLAVGKRLIGAAVAGALVVWTIALQQWRGGRHRRATNRSVPTGVRFPDDLLA